MVRVERNRDWLHWEPWLLFESPVSGLDLFDPTAGDPPVQFYCMVRET